MSIVICLVTVPSHEVGAALAKSLVDKRVAACVNIIPGIHSIYRWEESIAIEQEALLMIKTDETKVTELKEAVLKEHPYDVPEFVVVSPKDVEPRYAAWVKESVAQSS